MPRRHGDANIPVYVVGVPGSGPYAALLDALATAGGTARPTLPYYYAVDSTSTAAFQDAMSQIAAKITATCTLQLQMPPADPEKVNVWLDDVVVPKDPVDGWSLDPATGTITLLGATCQRVLDGNALDIRIIAGCPTVVR
jgi:hypothetical protein